jgi:hypothetical protein
MSNLLLSSSYHSSTSLSDLDREVAVEHKQK